jgi:hypothetical protein
MSGEPSRTRAHVQHAGRLSRAPIALKFKAEDAGDCRNFRERILFLHQSRERDDFQRDTNHRQFAFSGCPNLKALYFLGDASSVPETAFSGTTNATALYLPLKSGWTGPSEDAGPLRGFL